jgi:hypothetical protein
MLPTVRPAALAAALLTLLLVLPGEAPGWGGLNSGYSGPGYIGFGAPYPQGYGGVNTGGFNTFQRFGPSYMPRYTWSSGSGAAQYTTINSAYGNPYGTGTYGGDYHYGGGTGAGYGYSAGVYRGW